METFLIIGVCVLCYEICELLQRYCTNKENIKYDHLTNEQQCNNHNTTTTTIVKNKQQQEHFNNNKMFSSSSSTKNTSKIYTITEEFVEI